MQQGNAATVLTVDGSFGEGGGQIVRTSVSLAAITGRTVEITNIRARRSKPGLQAQHLTSVLAAAALCQAELRGAELNSQYLLFRPGTPIRQSQFTFDVAAARGGASAGATGLVAQTLLVPITRLLPEPTTVRIQGGTHVPMSPSADYLQFVYAPFLGHLGWDVSVCCERAGFFPRGGGEITIQTQGGSLNTPLDAVQRGRLRKLQIVITTSLLPEHVRERGGQVLLKELEEYSVPVHIEARDLPGAGAGAGVMICASCEQGGGGWTALGEKGKPMEKVALEALRAFQEWFASGAGVEEHLADQLVLPCAFIPGTSSWTTPRVTDHLRTVLAVVEQFLPVRSRIEEGSDGIGRVTLQGVGA